MTKYTGRDISIGIGKEASRGTPVSATFWIPRSSFDFEEKVTTIVDEQGYGVIEDSVDVKVVNKWTEGSLTGMLRDKAIGLFLLNAFGAVTSTPEGSDFKHTFTIAQNHQHPSLTIATDGGVADIAYPLGMLKSLEINAAINENVLFTADLISKSGTPVAATASYVVENTFTGADVKVYFADAVAELGAAPEAKIKSAKITIEKEVEKDDILGLFTADDLLNKTTRLSIEIEKNYQDNTYRDMFVNGTGKAMKLAIGSGTASLTFTLNQVKIMDWNRDKGLDDIMKETFTLKGNFKLADAKMVEAVLINSQASY